MANLSEHERLNLQKMINESECDDNTEHIRKVKHSILLRDEIRKLDTFRKANRSLQVKDFDKFVESAAAVTPFLHTNYTDIFNRITKDELDLEIMTKLLIVLKMIEDNKVNQHEGSVMVGKVLKELYVDSALKRGENLDKANEVQTIEISDDSNNISWKEYKQLHLTK
jgi:hypothetical protein